MSEDLSAASAHRVEGNARIGRLLFGSGRMFLCPTACCADEMAREATARRPLHRAPPRPASDIGWESVEITRPHYFWIAASLGRTKAKMACRSPIGEDPTAYWLFNAFFAAESRAWIAANSFISRYDICESAIIVDILTANQMVRVAREGLNICQTLLLTVPALWFAAKVL